MKACIDLKLFASLSHFTPDYSDKYSITPGLTVGELLEQLGVSAKEAKLIFVNGKKGDLTSTLHGGERVGIFPPVGGG